MTAAAIEILHLGESDLPLLLCADERVFDNPIRPDRAAAFLADPNHEMVLARAGEGVVGMASGAILLHPDKAPAFFVNEVGVDEAFRRQGIGTGLMQRLFEVARARGCEHAWLGTEEENAAARALYRRFGAEETGGLVLCHWPDLGAAVTSR